jgi:hypothetical protein
MKTEHWANKALDASQDTTGAAPADDYRPRSYDAPGPKYFTKDVWVAAYLDVQHLEFLYCVFDNSQRPRWYFNDTDGQAYQAAQDFYNNEAVAPLQVFRKSYRFLQDMATAERERSGLNGNYRRAA